jgi:hypothetical protein
MYDTLGKATVLFHYPGIIWGGDQEDFPDLAAHKLVEKLEMLVEFMLERRRTH